MRTNRLLVLLSGLIVGACLVGGVLGANARAVYDSEHGYKLCDPNELATAACNTTRGCLNACANKCGSHIACRSCCTAFANDPGGYATCLALCKDVYDPNTAVDP